MELVKLSEVCALKTGKTPPTKNDKYFNGEINWYNPSDLDTTKFLGASNRKITTIAFDENKAVVFDKGFLLMTCIGEIGKVGITTEKCSSNQQITALIPNKEKINVEFLYYLIKKMKRYLSDYANNAVVPILNNKSLSKIKIPLPPLEEQQRIASILDKADALRQLNKQLIEKYTTLSQSLFLEMFGDPVTNPKGWEKVKFGNHISILTDYHANGSYKILAKNVTLKNEEDYALMVRTTDLENDNFSDDVKYIDERAYNFLEKTKVFGNEIIINKIGSAGNVYLMPKLNRPVSLGMNAFMLRFKERLNTIFIYFQLKSHYGEREIKKRVKGAVTKTIRKDAVREIPIIYPPFSIQNEFAKRIQIIEQQKQNAEMALQKSEDLFNSLLQKAFKGEL